jgi:hypothetical protein
VQPFAVAPWAGEKIDAGLPPLVHALRGDFFCAPFGGNGTPWRGEKHPPHGESANANWTWMAATRGDQATSLHLQLKTKVRAGVIDKRITLRTGHSAIYCEHTLSGLSGPLALGTHPCLHVPGPEGAARVSAGGWDHGQVLPVPFEDPAGGGYSSIGSGGSGTHILCPKCKRDRGGPKLLTTVCARCCSVIFGSRASCSSFFMVLLMTDRNEFMCSPLFLS